MVQTTLRHDLVLSIDDFFDGLMSDRGKPLVLDLPRTTERPERESGDECSELPRREAP